MLEIIERSRLVCGHAFVSTVDASVELFHGGVNLVGILQVNLDVVLAPVNWEGVDLHGIYSFEGGLGVRFLQYNLTADAEIVLKWLL